MKFQTWTNEKKAGFILHQLKQADLSPSLLQQIQGWLLSEDNKAKEEILEEYFEDLFRNRKKPSKRAYELLADLNRRLGLEVRPLRTPIRKRLLFRACAVILPILLLAGASWLLVRESTKPDTGIVANLPAEKVSVHSAEGVPNELVLPDGSVVRLSGETELTYDVSNFTENRTLNLRGEAFFKVEKKEGRPFRVETDQVIVTVLGTEFNMRSYAGDNETIVSLTSGKIEVKDKNKSVTLSPMEQFRYDKRTGKSQVVKFDPELIDKWRFGKKKLNDIPLPEALRIAGDFFDKKVVIRGRLPQQKGVTTTLLEDSSPESVLRAIQFMSDESFGFRIESDTIFISAR